MNTMISTLKANSILKIYNQSNQFDSTESTLERHISIILSNYVDWNNYFSELYRILYIENMATEENFCETLRVKPNFGKTRGKAEIKFLVNSLG